MNTVKYELTEKSVFHNDDIHTSYGMSIYVEICQNNEVTLVASIDDITFDKQKLSELVQQCNRLKLSPIHLIDVIEDFLAS